MSEKEVQTGLSSSCPSLLPPSIRTRVGFKWDGKQAEQEQVESAAMRSEAVKITRTQPAILRRFQLHCPPVISFFLVCVCASVWTMRSHSSRRKVEW